MVNDDGDGIGKYLSEYIETGFSLDEIENDLYISAIDLMEYFDAHNLYDEYDDYPDEIGIQVFEMKLILDGQVP